MYRSLLALALCAGAFHGSALAQWQASSLPYPPGTTFYFVSKTAGDNVNGNGSVNAPWRDISFAYPAMVADVIAQTGNPYAPAALIVEPGYYAPSTGESYPIRMQANKFIGGVDAHTTILSLDQEVGQNLIFEFLGNRAQAAATNDPRFGPFAQDDGPYLERLTLRDTAPLDASNIAPRGTTRGIGLFSQTIDPVTGLLVADCDFMNPMVAELVIYGFHWGIKAEYARARVTDCTIALNDVGIETGGVPCCPEWDVVNCVVNGNSVLDLNEIDAGGVLFTNFTTAAVGNLCVPPDVGALPENTATQPGSTNPALAFATLGFVDPVAMPLAPGILEFEFDFRLTAASPLRGMGAWGPGPAPFRPFWDAEGFANLRLELTSAGPSDIGADQFNSFRITPFTRRFDPTVPTIDSVRVGFDNGLGSANFDLVVTPETTTQPLVFAVPLIQDPVFSLAFLPTPLVNPTLFDGFLAILPTTFPFTLVPGTPPQETAIPFSAPNNFPLVMQFAFLEFLPSGALRIVISNGQRHLAG
jgi:hypothetical protein